jgi:hypothetical protein
LSETETKDRIPDGKDKPVENGKEAEPEQEFLASSPPKSIDNESYAAESRYYRADNKESYSTPHKCLLGIFSATERPINGYVSTVHIRNERRVFKHIARCEAGWFLFHPLLEERRWMKDHVKILTVRIGRLNVYDGRASLRQTPDAVMPDAFCFHS